VPIQISFEEQELIVLRNLLNVAVMARGMEAAEACLELDKKIVAAAKAAKETKDERDQISAEPAE